MTQWGLDVLFNPAKRHMDEEKRRLQTTREEAGDASKGNRIDLASGKVTIRRKPAADVDSAAGDEVEAAAGAADDGAVADAIAEAAGATSADALTDATYSADAADEEAS
jgi:hypothetical protein